MRAQVALLISAALALAGCEKQKIEDAVKLTLIDADTAQFKGVEKCPGDPTLWSGEVNAKNRMGAFVGFEPFYYDGVSVSHLSDDGFSKLTERCYKTTPTTPEEKAKAAAEALNGDWEVGEVVDPVDDSKMTFASLTAGEDSNSGGAKAELTVRCSNNRTEVYINWDEYLGDDSQDVYSDWKRVTVRVGSEPAKTERWTISTNNNGAFSPKPLELAKRLVKADRFVAETVPYAENAATAVFNLKGAEYALKTVSQNCGWANE